MDRFYNFAKEHDNIHFWKDDENGLISHLNDDMALGVENSSVVIAFVSDAYFNSKDCHKELNYAESLDTKIVIVKLQKDVQLLRRGAVSLIAASKLYVCVSLQDFFSQLLFQVDYKENEHQFFLSILNAVEKTLSPEQSIVEVPVDIDTNIEEEEVAVNHRALLFLALFALVFIGAIGALCVTLGGEGHDPASISTTTLTVPLSTTVTTPTFAMLLLSTYEKRNEF